MKKKFIVSAECIIRSTKEKYLTIIRPEGKNAGGKISFPGGGSEKIDGINNNDFLKNIAIREVLEEVGINIKDDLKYIHSSIFFDEFQKKNVLHVVFLCNVVKTLIKVIPLKKEVIEYNWLTKDEIISYSNCPPWIKMYMELV